MGLNYTRGIPAREHYVPVHDPPGANGKAVYSSIKENLETWVDGGYKPS